MLMKTQSSTWTWTLDFVHGLRVCQPSFYVDMNSFPLWFDGPFRCEPTVKKCHSKVWKPSLWKICLLLNLLFCRLWWGGGNPSWLSQWWFVLFCWEILVNRFTKQHNKICHQRGWYSHQKEIKKMTTRLYGWAPIRLKIVIVIVIIIILVVVVIIIIIIIINPPNSPSQV